LTIRAHGEQIVPPVLIVRGTGQRVSDAELEHYASLKHVIVYFQERAWADGAFILWYFEDVFVPALRRNGLLDDQIVFLDNLGAHKVHYVKKFMMENNLLPMYLPANMTSVCQPVDRHIGENLKKKMKARYQIDKKTNEAIWRAYNGRYGPNDALNARNRRMLMATWLDESWDDMRSQSDFLGAFLHTGCLMKRDGTNFIKLVGHDSYSYSCAHDRLNHMLGVDEECDDRDLIL
jgi:hypothetical protein